MTVVEERREEEERRVQCRVQQSTVKCSRVEEEKKRDGKGTERERKGKGKEEKSRIECRGVEWSFIAPCTSNGGIVIFTTKCTCIQNDFSDAVYTRHIYLG